jgi:hypothetical protein
MTQTIRKSARKHSPVKKCPVTWGKPRFPATGGFSMSKRSFPGRGKPSFVLYDIYDADADPGVGFLDFYKIFIKNSGEVFVWSGQPSLDQRREVISSACRDGVAVVLHTIPKHAQTWRRTVEQTVQTGNKTCSNFTNKPS